MSENSESLDSDREESSCFLSSPRQLLNALTARNLEKFQQVLRSSRPVDINHVYEDPHNKSLLDIACSSPHCAPFVQVLIKSGAALDSVNVVHKRSPLHFAIECSDLDTVRLLVDSCENVNVRDSFGNSPLHKAAELDKVDVVELLLQHPEIQVNLANRKLQTPLHLAARKGSRNCAVKLIQDERVDLDTLRDFSRSTCREMVISKLPGVELQRAARAGQDNTTLFSLLHSRDVKAFSERCAKEKGRVNEDDGSYTLLQFACLHGLTDAVQVLLENGADPNFISKERRSRPPIMMAAHQGYLNIVQMLTQYGPINYAPTEDGTVLHVALDGMMQTHDTLGAPHEIRQPLRCLEYFLKNVSADVLNINALNNRGETALHRAVRLHEKNVIRLLLDRGAYIGTRCVFGNMPISLIDPETFKEYLDSCVSTNGKRAIEESYEVVYNYQFLVPPKACPRGLSSEAAPFEAETGTGTGSAEKSVVVVVSETEPLIELSRVPELRHLLKHPVLTSFLNLKWFTIRKYFWMNLSFYLTFWVFLTYYVLTVYSIEQNTNEEHVRISRELYSTRLLLCPCALLCVLLLLRELFQFSVSPRRYLSELENWLEIALLASTISILSCQLTPQFAAVAILLSWAELVLLIGRHPYLSTNIEMFKVVCSNFLKLLAWYSILILAFALSFYLLFKDARKSVCNGNSTIDGADDAQFFEAPGTSIFKAVIMLTGEFDASSIPFTCHPGISHVLFVLFVFLIAIVLFNLLNGLAVSDTQAIRSDAEIVGNVCRAQLIAYIERMATGDPLAFLNVFDWLTCWCCCVPSRGKPRMSSRRMKLFYERINLFPHVLPDMSAHVLPNQGNLVNFLDCPQRGRNSNVNVNANANANPKAGCGRCTNWYIDKSIVKQAKEIIIQRDSREEDPLQIQLEAYKERFDSLERISRKNEQKLNELMEVLKRKF